MIVRFVSGVGLLALVAGCRSTVAQSDPGMGASGDEVTTQSYGPDAASGSPADASSVDASSADTASAASVDASIPNDAPFDANAIADSAAIDAPGAIGAGSCDYVDDTAPVVTATVASGPLPAYSKGGTIADGTYWLTGIVDYAVPSAPDLTYQETVEIFGTSWNNVDAYMGMTRRATETLAVQGATGTLAYTCDSLNNPLLLQTTVSFTFEVDGDTLLVADETDGYLLTYERQSP